MSRFIGNPGVIDNLQESGNFAMTGNLVVPVSPASSSALMPLSNACTCLDPGTKRTQCMVSIYNCSCCQTNGGGANQVACTWVVPAAVQRATFQMWGAGGGGGRGCGPAGRGVGVGGGSGAFVQFTACVTAGDTWCLKAGGGGTGLTYGGQGCRGDCSCICRVGGGLNVTAFGGGGGSACRDCNGSIGSSGSYGGCFGVNDATLMVGPCILRCGQRVVGRGPYCACGYCCRSASQRGGDAFMSGGGAWGNCRYSGGPCSDSGGKFALGPGGGGAGGTGHGSGQGLYSTPCCRGGRGGAGMILIWM